MTGVAIATLPKETDTLLSPRPPPTAVIFRICGVVTGLCLVTGVSSHLCIKEEGVPAKF